MKHRKRNHRCLIEPLEPRSLLSGYSATEINWLPATRAGLQPMQITNSGLITILDGDATYICTIAKHRGYAVPSILSDVVINDKGQLAALDKPPGRDVRTAIDTDGVLTEIPAATNLNGQGGSADGIFIPTSINNNGYVVGTFNNYFFPIPPADLGGYGTNLIGEYNPTTGQTAEITAIGLAAPVPAFINDAGQVAFTNFSGSNPAIFDPISAQVSNVAPAIFSETFAINAAGDVVGGLSPDVTANGFFYRAQTDTVTMFPATRGVKNFSPQAINDHDVIVGAAEFLEKIRNHHIWQQRAAIHASGRVIDLNALTRGLGQSILTEAVGINDSNQILAADAAEPFVDNFAGDHVFVVASD